MNENQFEDEFSLEIDADEITLDAIIDEPEESGLPKVYLYLENLVMLEQVKGLVDNLGDLITVPVYADKRGVPAYVGIVELTSENVLTMQQLGLHVSLVREGKETINFDQADHYMQIVKTLKKADTHDVTFEIEEEKLTEVNTYSGEEVLF